MLYFMWSLRVKKLDPIHKAGSWDLGNIYVKIQKYNQKTSTNKNIVNIIFYSFLPSVKSAWCHQNISLKFSNWTQNSVAWQIIFQTTAE